MNAQPRVGIYLRVSTDEQNVSLQKSELETYCARRGWKRIKIYEEKESGAKANRAQLEELMNDVRKGKIETVMVWKLDRLGRSLPHLALIFEELQSCKVGLVCITQGIDTTAGNPAARLQLNVLGAVAEFERDLIKERTRAGMQEARKRGVRFGRPNTLAKREQEVLALKAQGKGIRAISKALNMPASSVALILKRAATK